MEKLTSKNFKKIFNVSIPQDDKNHLVINIQILKLFCLHIHNNKMQSKIDITISNSKNPKHKYYTLY